MWCEDGGGTYDANLLVGCVIGKNALRVGTASHDVEALRVYHGREGGRGAGCRLSCAGSAVLVLLAGDWMGANTDVERSLLKGCPLLGLGFGFAWNNMVLALAIQATLNIGEHDVVVVPEDVPVVAASIRDVVLCDADPLGGPSRIAAGLQAVVEGQTGTSGRHGIVSGGKDTTSDGGHVGEKRCGLACDVDDVALVGGSRAMIAGCLGGAVLEKRGEDC